MFTDGNIKGIVCFGQNMQRAQICFHFAVRCIHPISFPLGEWERCAAILDIVECLAYLLNIPSKRRRPSTISGLSDCLNASDTLQMFASGMHF